MVRKLREKHRVRRADVVEAFANRIDDGPVDDREQHRTDPPSHWFISETNFGRRLKIVYMVVPGKGVVIKTAFEPNAAEEKLYARWLAPPEQEELNLPESSTVEPETDGDPPK